MDYISFEDQLIENFENEIKKNLFSCLGVEQSMLGTSKNDTLTLEAMKKSIEELRKYDIEFKASPYAEFNSMIVVDHEKIREEIPSHTERGKTVLYNPNNKLIVEELKKRGYL